MTDRFNSVTVVFDHDIREDDLENWINAIRMMRNVIEVIPVAEGNSLSGGYYQAKYELRNLVYGCLKDFR